MFKDKNLQYVFRAQIHSDQYGQAFAGFMAEHAKAKLGMEPKDVRIALIHEDGPYGVGVAAADEAYSKEAGLQIVLKEGYSASAPDLPPIFQADRVYIKPDMVGIIRGFLHLKELQIAAPKIRYVVGKDGRTNLPQTSSSSGSTPDYLITQVEIHDGFFQFENLRDETALTLPRWQLRIKGTARTREHTLDFSCLQQSSFKYQAHTIPIEQLKLSGTLRRTSFQVDAAYLSAANSQLSAKGSISDFSNPVISLQLNPNLDLNALARAAGFKEPIRGNLVGTIQADGRLQNLQIEA